MYPGRGDDDAGFIFIVLDDLRDYIHRCVLTEPRPRDKPDKTNPSPVVFAYLSRITHAPRFFLTVPPRVSSHSQEAGLERYAIAGKEDDWDDALAGGKVPKSGMLSVKRKHGADADAATPEKKSSKKDKKGDKGHKGKGGKTPKSSSKKSKHKA